MKTEFLKEVALISGLMMTLSHLKNLKKNGYPYSMACFAINTTEIIAFGSERDSQTPRDIIDENQNSNFMVDFNKKPKQMDTMLGHMTVYYAKKV